MNILLLNPPNIEEPPIEAKMLPMGLLSIFHYLKQKNYDCKIVNLFHCDNWQKVSDELDKYDYTIIGISCFSRQRFSVLKLAELCKRKNPNAKIVLGGPHVSFLDKIILQENQHIDFIVRGEGELKFELLLQAIINDKGLSQISGLTFRMGKEFVCNPDFINDVDLHSLPIPLYKKEELDIFSNSESLSFHFSEFETNMLIAPLVFSRGCNYTCLFCCNGHFWKTQRSFSKQQIIQQIEYYYNELGVRFFDVYDDNLLFDSNIVEGVLNYIVDKNYDIQWWCSTRLDTIQESTIPLLQKAGCFMISIGIESGSEKVLKIIDKANDLKYLDFVSKKMSQYNIKTRVTISIGYSGETLEDIKETINLINDIKPSQVAVFLLKVYPGTKLYSIWKLQGINDDLYWFDKTKEPVPFYLDNKSIDDLLFYRDYLIKNIKAEVIHRIDSVVHSVELFLKWEK
ncbi:MAG: B12-binding domain-containing radical SAM protein [Candidatus Cloacimonetes bacterium]|nr:B12-binding domain-containing radical SAM protein [Candidatus Cloacimonadota bacterium]